MCNLLSCPLVLIGQQQKGYNIITVKLFHFQDSAPLLMLLSLCSLSYKSHLRSPRINTLLVPYIDAAAVGSGELHRSSVSHSNPRFASNGERIMQIPARAFQQMKIFTCTTKKG